MIAISGMEMPEYCMRCPVFDGEYGLCNIIGDRPKADPTEERPEDCPLTIIKNNTELPSIAPAHQKGKWIPCSKRLPKKGEQVLCCNNKGSVFTSAITYVSDGGCAYFGQHFDVIAWMPLPEPYKAESEE